MANGTCHLCRSFGSLRQSHILPAFVARWLKKTSATGVLRRGSMPNRPVQDTLKIPLLCDDCERRFCKWETEFYQRVFLPWHSRKPASGSYGPWLHQFLVSLVWRIASVEMNRDGRVPNRLRPGVERALGEWRSVLMGPGLPAKGSDVHLVFFRESLEDPDDILPDHWNHYLARCVGFKIANDQRLCAAYVKLPGMAAWGCISPRRPRGWHGTSIQTAGVLAPQQKVVNLFFLATWVEHSWTSEDILSRRSPRQLKRAREAMVRNPARTHASESWRASQADAELKRARARTKL